jgi:hypothetical protein
METEQKRVASASTAAQRRRPCGGEMEPVTTCATLAVYTTRWTGKIDPSSSPSADW